MYLARVIQKHIRDWNRSRLSRKHGLKTKHYPHALGILGIMKNESQTIDEWISHYIQVGASKIYLIDNGSTDETVEKAKAWVDKGLVELVELPRPHRQLFHYWYAIKKFNIRKNCKWLLIADLDEFWFCPDGQSIPEKLKVLDYFHVIYANWVLFGSSGFLRQPESIRCAFVKREPKIYHNLETKYIVRTSAIKRRTQIQIHKFRGADSARTISDNENFALFHYRIQSREYFDSVKISRGDALFRADDLQIYNVRNDAYFREFDARCVLVDRRLADLVEQGRLGKS
jgi:hypothetical protein